MGGRERANLIRPPSQVDRCHPVSVHYYSTFSTPEFSFQSFVRLESLPASRTSHTRTSGLTPGQSNDCKTSPSSLVLYLPAELPRSSTRSSCHDTFYLDRYPYGRDSVCLEYLPI